MKQLLRSLVFSGPIGRIVARQLSRPKGLLAGWIGKEMNRSNESLYSLTVSKIPAKGNLRIVEFGFGNGRFISEILWERSGANYIGVEASDEMVELAKVHNAKLIESGHVKLISSSQLDEISKNSASVVVLINLIYFWSNPAKELRQILSILEPSGRLVVGIRPEETLKSLPFTKWQFTIRTEGEWLRIFADSGFELIESASVQGGSQDELDGLVWVFVLKEGAKMHPPMA